MTLAQKITASKSYRKGFEMNESIQEFGFAYFSSPDYLVSKKINTWMPVFRKMGAGVVVIQANFARAVPEDIFLSAKDNQLTPVVHFSSELPLARKFNEVAYLLEIYAKWGVRDVIFGDKPNMKRAWPIAGWHYESLVDHFLDRYIPLATQAVRLGLNPVTPPLQPGGDYWDTAFMELFLSGLKRRQLSTILDHLILSSYGYTFDKPLNWGQGGPERWSVSEPYQKTHGEQDQLGFNHFEWMLAIGQKATGKSFQTLILDAGNPYVQHRQIEPEHDLENIRQILRICDNRRSDDGDMASPSIAFDDSIRFCSFSLDTLSEMMEKPLEPKHLLCLFEQPKENKSALAVDADLAKPIKHYLLLPIHGSSVSDAILNKVRPIIKLHQPTIGFSLSEAALAEKVSIYPDHSAFTDDAINQLRNSGSVVKILPESGIEIATSLRGT
jgi:hypothetical protein